MPVLPEKREAGGVPRGELHHSRSTNEVRPRNGLRGKAVGTSAAHIRRAAVRGLGTFTWGFLLHSPASVLAHWKNRRDARIVSVEKPWESPWESRGKLAIGVLPGDLPPDMVTTRIAHETTICYNISNCLWDGSDVFSIVGLCH